MTKLQDFLNAPVPTVSAMRKGAKAGDLFGLELECEGKNVDFLGNNAEILNDWAPHADGSLRNHHGSSCEWVFNGPVSYDNSVKRVDKLFDFFDKQKAKLVCSNRTSFHVHFNMGDKNAYQLVNLFILFTILEDILDGYCGDDRRGNLFCLSSRHAEDQVRWMQDACFKSFSFANFREEWRYCSLNLASVNKFGTVEFRAMRGLDNKADILAWVSILKEFCDYSCYTMKNPAELIETISRKTPIGFLKDVFSPDNFKRLTEKLDENQINGSIYEGLRLVQMLSYRIATEFDQVRLRGRDFWASFGGDAEPVLDVPAEVLQARGAPPARGARVARPVGLGAAFGEQVVQAAPEPVVAGNNPDWLNEAILRQRAEQQAEQIRQRDIERRAAQIGAPAPRMKAIKVRGANPFVPNAVFDVEEDD
jgi:hypothetical protein